MKFIKRVGVLAMLMLVALTLFACKLPEAPSLSCSGVVTFSEQGLTGVVIKSNVKEYATTNENGEYNFDTKAKSLVIYPVKEGYMFEPKQIEIESGENTEINFIAIEIEELVGTLSLGEVIITPTSISSNPDNYLFTSEGKECLKASDITISYEGETYLLNQEPIYLFKTEGNQVLINEEIFGEHEIAFECGKSARIGVLINAYFTKYYQEWETTDAIYTYLDITKPQTNADLIDGQVYYNLYGINSKARAFTFDVTFVFDFEEAL